jgi:hypothetical protein
MTLPDLKSYFQNTKLPDSIQLKNGEFICDVKLFVNGHISVLESNKGNRRFLGYYSRLVELFEVLGNA